MRKNATKLAAAVLSLAMVMTSVSMPASAAKKKTTKINKSTATLYTNGSKSQKSTTLYVTVGGKKVKATFKSSNTKILTVAKKTGKVTAKKPGKATVTATYKKKNYKCKVTVKAYATSVKVSPTTVSLVKGKTKVVKATVSPSNASNKKVSFKSSNKAVATVSSTGKITAKKAGTAKITVTALGSKKAAKKAYVTVKVTNPAPAATETPVVTETPAATETPVATVTPSAVATEGTITITTNVSGASVKVVSGSTVVAEGTTATGTAFTTAKLENGTYTVTVSKDGYKELSKVVTVNGDVEEKIELEKVNFEASQIGRQTIKVIGDNLTDNVADYVVKKGNINVAIDSVKVSDDKTTATLTSASSSLSADENYTVSFKGGAAYKFAVVAEKATKIAVKGNDLVLDTTGKKGTIYFNVYNQFTERMKTEVTPTCTIGTGSAITTRNTEDTKLDINLGAGLNTIGTKGVLILVDQKTGITSGQIEVKVNAVSKIAKIDVLGLYKKGTKPEAVKEIATDATPSDYTLAFKAYDQYGKELSDTDLSSWGSDVTVTPVGVNALNLATTVSTITIGNDKYLSLDLTGSVSVAGTQTFTIVSNSVGLLGTATVNVVNTVGVAKVKIAPIDTIYNKTEAQIEYTAVDTQGKEVTDFNALNSLGIGIFNAAGKGTFRWERTTDGKAKLYFKPNIGIEATGETGSQPVSIITTVGTSSVEVATFNVYNAKKVKAIVGFTADTTLAALGDSAGDIKILNKNLKVQDQYGNLLTAKELVELNSDYSIKAVKDGENTAFASTYDTETALAENDAEDTAIFTLATNSGVKNTSTKYKFTLYNADGTEIKDSDYTVTLKNVDIEDVSDFAIDTIKTKYVANNADGKVDTGTGDIEIKVTGKVAGATVEIPATSYNLVLSGRISEGNSKGIQVAAGVDGVYADKDKKTEGTVDETFEVVIKNNAGTSVKQKLTLSSVAKKVATVKPKDATGFKLVNISGGDDNSIAQGGTIGAVEIKKVLDIKDQYEGDKEPNSLRIKFTNLPKDFTVANNNTTNAELTVAGSAKAGMYTVTVEVNADGVVYTDTLVVEVK